MQSNVDALEEARALLADGAEVVHLRDRKERDPVLGMVTVDDSTDMLPLLAALVAELEAARAVVEKSREVVRQQLGDNLDWWTPEMRQSASSMVTVAALATADALKAYDAAKAGKAVE